MIAVARPSWQTELANAYREPSALLRALDLPANTGLGKHPHWASFSLRVPRGFVARMRKGDPHDPLLRQVLPGLEEGIPSPCFSQDPVADLAAMPVPGLIHKYRGRVLLLATRACAVHCRYCFRRHLPPALAGLTKDHWHRAVHYIEANPTISEVILSGGDPLSLTDEKLALLTSELAHIPHLKRLRVHSRLPIVLPERVTDTLLEWLCALPLSPVMVLHVNHPNEFDDSVTAALKRLKNTNVTLLNQSVLLQGVNDSVATLARLSETLFAAGALPYYLHLLDWVQGAAHFEVPEDRAREILRGLRAELPGYLVPKLVREIPGSPSKLPVG